MNEIGWLRRPEHLTGPHFAAFQVALTRYNAERLLPRLPDEAAPDEVGVEAAVMAAEIASIEAQRRAVAPLIGEVPSDADAFVAWFERLKESGPGQGDALFPWLAKTATVQEMCWFLLQEVAGEAGFDDLLALTQLKMPTRAKLEMARNFWDEMGRGAAKGMHGPMLERLAAHLQLSPSAEVVVPEALALGNTMIAMARHRRYAFHSVGALGAIELTAPTRAGHVERGLRRLGVPAGARHYFAVHAVLDVRHSRAWNREALHPLVREDPRRARAIAEGAVIRLWHGSRCFARYRREFGLGVAGEAAA